MTSEQHLKKAEQEERRREQMRGVQERERRQVVEKILNVEVFDAGESGAQGQGRRSEGEDQA